MEEKDPESSSKSTPGNILEATDYDLHLSSWSIEGLRASAIQLKLPQPQSLAWAILLNAVPPPSGDIISSMRAHRTFYEDLKLKLSMDPRAVLEDDPLSQNDESVWKQHFCDNELKALILLDVVRTFPEEPFFRDKEVQDMMVRVLFLWSRAHAHVGYRQGMHEVLAPLILQLREDRLFAPASLRYYVYEETHSVAARCLLVSFEDCYKLSRGARLFGMEWRAMQRVKEKGVLKKEEFSDTLKYYLNESSLESDSFMLFSAVMRGLERFYTTGNVAPNASGRLPTTTAAHNPNEVVRYLERVREEYLVPMDPELAAHLADHNITMELFGIRWLRLLFGREFSRRQLGALWGLLFSEGPALPLLPYVLVAMLVAVRAQLLEGDGGAALSCVMRAHLAPARHVCELALHLRAPQRHPRPPPVALLAPDRRSSSASASLEQIGSGLGVGATGADSDSGSEGVPEGGDVARELAALALLRAQLPPAAAALARALPKPSEEVARPLQQILQLAALLQCRNHALIDVETALEAAEAQGSDRVGRRQLVPISIIGGKGTPVKQKPKLVGKVKEVPLKLFTQKEGDSANKDLPSLDPLGLRTE